MPAGSFIVDGKAYEALKAAVVPLGLKAVALVELSAMLIKPIFVDEKNVLDLIFEGAPLAQRKRAGCRELTIGDQSTEQCIRRRNMGEFPCICFRLPLKILNDEESAVSHGWEEAQEGALLVEMGV